ncbi:tyrosine-type recombinase/integrase [Mycobacterium intracellulare]|uniref:tyrosine-type recombinase/integrase n=1 Tax=Mycobacterium intracellulare TaxID=1767 RepID=UPI0035DE87B6|nr:tyrosine-type recombinase/integrase [Mycobacterium intracellulare]
MVRLLAECGLRAGELLALTVDDVDLAAAMAIIRRGKDGKARIVPFGAVTARSLDRYLRLRRNHSAADTKSALTWCTHASTSRSARAASDAS